MLLFGMIASALIFGALLADFTPAWLVQVIQGSALATMVLNVIALWKQETRRPGRMDVARERPRGTVAVDDFVRGGNVLHRVWRRAVRAWHADRDHEPCLLYTSPSPRDRTR